jgi:hypothetical protein
MFKTSKGRFGLCITGETNAGRLLGVVATERGDNARVVTAYDLNARQRRNYHAQRDQESERNEQEDA